MAMSYIAERRQEEKERRRTEILDAAEQVTGSVGWDELTMDQVARRARLSRALLYVYFKDKVDLLFALCERALIVMQEHFRQGIKTEMTGLEQVIGAGKAYVTFSQQFPVYFDIVARCSLREVNTTDPGANEVACHGIGDAMLVMIVGALEKGVADGTIRGDLGNPLVAATALWGFTHGVVQVVATKGRVLTTSGIAPAEMLDQALRMARRSLVSRPS